MSKSFLEVDGLSKVYPDGQGGELTVFEDIRFALEKGEFVCIIGHSGCGKSTVLKLLLLMPENILRADLARFSEFARKVGRAMARSVRLIAKIEVVIVDEPPLEL